MALTTELLSQIIHFTDELSLGKMFLGRFCISVLMISLPLCLNMDAEYYL